MERSLDRRPTSTAPALEDLLEHRAFVERLAHRLVVDPATADDVVQETWLVAMRNPPRHDGALQGWLSSVVRHVALRSFRTSSRRASHESQARPGTASVGAATEVEAEDLRRDLAREVAELPSHYRSVVELRFYEGLPPRSIATQLRLPVETVRTRTRRACDLLRGKLDKRYGDRVAWAGIVLAHFPARPELAAASGAALSSTSLRVGLLVLVGLLSTAAVWFVIGSDAGTRAALPSEVSERERSTDAVAGAAGTRTPAAGPSAAPAVLPTLTVAVRDARTPDPAAVGVLVTVNSGARRRTLLTDGRGFAVFADLDPGTWVITTDVGGRSNVLLNEDRTTTLRLPVTLEVSGRVLDETGTPVADAIIMIHSPRPVVDTRRELPVAGAERARTDDLGSFRIERAAWSNIWPTWISARKPGYAASTLHRLTSPAGPATIGGQAASGVPWNIDLRIDSRETVLRGVVLDSSGRPIENAFVGPGRKPARLSFGLDGNAVLEPTGGGDVTDRSGQFELRELGPGRHLIDVAARGYAPRSLSPLGRGAPRDLAPIELVPGFGITGEVRGPDGTPQREATVLARTIGARAYRVATVATDETGRYTLESLPWQTLELTAWSPYGFTSVQLEPPPLEAAEATKQQDLTLDASHELYGNFVDDTGRALAGQAVVVRIEDPLCFDPAIARRDCPPLCATTDDAGRFLAPPLGSLTSDALFTVAVVDPASRFALAYASGCRRADLPIELKLEEPARLTGRLPFELADAGARIWVTGGAPGELHELECAADGSFASDELAPGPRTVALWTVDRLPEPVLGVVLEPGALVDLGLLDILSTGTLALRLTDHEGAPAGAWNLTLTGPHGSALRAGHEDLPAGFDLRDGTLTVAGLSAGVHTLKVVGPGGASGVVEVSIAPSRLQELALELAPAELVELELHFPGREVLAPTARPGAPARAALRLHDGKGVTYRESRIPYPTVADHVERMRIALPRGRIHVTALVEFDLGEGVPTVATELAGTADPRAGTPLVIILQ